MTSSYLWGMDQHQYHLAHFSRGTLFKAVYGCSIYFKFFFFCLVPDLDNCLFHHIWREAPYDAVGF